tara:strand:+ start:804 stop:1148 length:345 start_codon:yes stop_codon:yes gene_type:complete
VFLIANAEPKGGMFAGLFVLLIWIAAGISLGSSLLMAPIGYFLREGKRPALIGAIMVSSFSASWCGFFSFMLLKEGRESGLEIVMTLLVGSFLFHLLSAGYLIFSPAVRSAFRR